MLSWPHEIVSYTPFEVQMHCVGDTLWQDFRRSLKGLSTERKLDKLQERRDMMLVHAAEAGYDRRWRVQESNYINALKRGGQLSMDLKVQR